MLPPPAPISIRSTIGSRTGRPLPFLKRRTRAVSNSVVTSGSPPEMRQAFAVGTPDVECQQIRPFRATGDYAGSECARSRAGFQHADRYTFAEFARDDATVRLHDPECCANTLCCETRLDLSEVTPDDRHHVCVQDGRHRALVLADLGDDLGGKRERDRGSEPLRDLTDPLLVDRIAVCMKQAHRDRLCPARHQSLQRIRDFLVGQGEEYGTAMIDPFCHLDPQLARHDGIGIASLEVVDVIAELAADLDDVLEPACRDQARASTLAFDDQVRHRRGRTGDHMLDLVASDPGPGEHAT